MAVECTINFGFRVRSPQDIVENRISLVLDMDFPHFKGKLWIRSPRSAAEIKLLKRSGNVNILFVINLSEFSE